MKKYFIAVLALAALLTLQTVVCTAESTGKITIESSLNDGTVTISGAIDAGCSSLLFVIYKPGADADSITDSTVGGVISRVDTIPVGDDGKIFFPFLMTDEESGEYTAYVKYGDVIERVIFDYVSESKKYDIVTAVNELGTDASDGEINAVYEMCKEYLKLPDKSLSMLPQDERSLVLKKVFANKSDYENAAKIKEEFVCETFVALVNAKADNKTLRDMSSEYESFLSLESNEKLFAYVKNDSMRDLLIEALRSDTYADITKVRAAYENYAFVAVLNDISDYAAMHDYLYSFANELGGLVFDEYNKLTNDKRRSVDTDMINTVFNSVSDVKPTFDKYIKNYADVSSGGGSGGGGGGNGSKSNITLPSVPDAGDDSNANLPIFSDMSSVPWAQDAVNYLAALNIVSGRGNGLFEPNAMVTRSEFVKLAVTALNADMTNVREVEFSDVDSDDWSYGYIMFAAANGIVNGNPDGSFGKDDFVSREDMAVIICRALKNYAVMTGGEQASFADEGDIADYAVESVYTLRRLGIVNGDGNNRFLPKGNATRAEAAKMICGFYKAIH